MSFLDDPFFTSSETIQPVYATKTLETGPDLSTNKYHRETKPQPRPERTLPPKPKPEYENKRLPSMLNDITNPKPLKINKNWPPMSIKVFNCDPPQNIKYAQPYE